MTFTTVCPSGTVYSEGLKVCVYPYDADREECKDNKYNAMSNNAYEDNGLYHDEWSDDQAPKQDEHAPARPVDDTPCEEEGFLTDRYDCTVFYECTLDEETGMFTKHKFNCAEGTAFSPAKNNTCDFKEDVDRCNQQIAADSFTQSQSQSQSNNNQQSTMSSMNSSNNGGQQSSSSSSSSSSSNSSSSSSSNTTTINNNNGGGNGNNGQGKLSNLVC